MRQSFRRGVHIVMLATIVVLTAHASAGHVHADILTDVPVSGHSAGDEHHEAVSVSCEALRTAASFDLVVPGPAFHLIRTNLDGRGDEPRALCTTERPPTPPLFLLHASLLI